MHFLPPFREAFAAELKQQERDLANGLSLDASTTPPRNSVGIVADTPNLTRTAQAVFGELARPDFRQLLNLARVYGVVSPRSAFAVCNGGVPQFVQTKLHSLGFSVTRGTGAADCDDEVFRLALSTGIDANTLLIASGDHIYEPVVKALVGLGKCVIVCGVRARVARQLRERASLFLDLPIRFVHPVPKAGAGAFAEPVAAI